MHTTTLQGVFPEPSKLVYYFFNYVCTTLILEPVYRRNFIKENVKSIKQMQGLLQEAGVIQPKQAKEDKFKNAPSIRRSRGSSPFVSRVPSQDKLKLDKTVKRSSLKPKLDWEKEKTEIMGQRKSKFTHRAMQTERTEDLTKLYESGIIKYPSPGVGRSKVSPKTSPHKTKGQGDALEGSMQNLGKFLV